MARVFVENLREQASHFGLYKTSAGGDKEIIVRRKVAEPSDYMHPTSKALNQQKEILALASQHYAHLTPSQKAETRRQFAEVEYQRSHGKTDLKLLTGRQLFIAQEVRSLKATGKQIKLPLEICIILTDPDLNPIEGQLWLLLFVDENWYELERDQLSSTDWLFPRVFRGADIYHPIGQAVGYEDLEDPETTYLAEDQLKGYHYHILYPTGLPEKLFKALGTSGMIYGLKDTYEEARNTPLGVVVDDNSSAICGQAKEGDEGFYIWRAGLFFDTSEIPATATILEAWLRLQVQFGGKRSAILDPDQTLIILSAEYLSHGGLTPSDYAQIGTHTISYGECSAEDWFAHSNQLIDIPIDSSLIVKEGISKLAMRGSHDINNIPDAGFIERNRFDYESPRRPEHGKAWLRIKYTD